MSEEKTYIVTLAESCPHDDAAKLKLQVSEKGGKIVEEFSLIKGFVVKLNAPLADFIKDHHFVHSIEEDKEVHIQK